LGESYLVYAHKRRSALSDDEVKLPKESWTQEILLKAEADKYNENLPSLSTSVCSRTEHLRWVKDEVDKVRELARNGLQNGLRNRFPADSYALIVTSRLDEITPECGSDCM
jgi:hypothetical protein